ncbi:MAG: hypothetical protein DMF63_04625 [Acidobacteria bacterium]|nr:MAG: hypothetical protein DMF63_04625 [Acidobacteriota bacterium]
MPALKKGEIEMKRSNIFIAMLGLLVFAGVSGAQTIKFGVKYPSPDKVVTEVNFPAPPDRNFVIFEAAIPARTEADCFASRNFANAVPVSTDRASTVYDPTTGTWFLRNSNSTSPIESCTVLLVRSSIGSNDLMMWQANYGTSAFYENDEKEEQQSGEANPAKAQRNMATSFTLTFNGQTTVP